MTQVEETILYQQAVRFLNSEQIGNVIEDVYNDSAFDEVVRK